MQRLPGLIGAALVLLAQRALADESEPGDMPPLDDAPAPPPTDPCRATGACARAGACFSGKYHCVARSEADCRASNRCAEGGHCLLDEEQQRCVSPAELAQSSAPSTVTETRRPGRPGLVGGGVAVLLAGVGIWVGNAAWIAYEDNRSGYGQCNESELFCGSSLIPFHVLVGLIGTGAIGGGIAMVVLGDRPKTVMVPYPRATQPPPTIDLGLAAGGLWLRGSF